MYEKFTKQTAQSIMFSKEEAERLHNNYIGPEHLLLGLLRQDNCDAVDILEALHVNLEALKYSIEVEVRDKQLPDTDQSAINNPDLTKEAQEILNSSIVEAGFLNDKLAKPVHVLLAILKSKSMLNQLFNKYDVSYRSVFNAVVKAQQPNGTTDMSAYNNDDNDDDEDFEDGDMLYKKTKSEARSSNTDTPVLDKYSSDITKAAEEDKLDPVVGREKEIQRIAQILGRRKKNNPILIGEPGVGKSAIVEGLAIRINEKKVSRILFNKRVLSLNMASVVAGTKYRGQFEERLNNILRELKENPDIILFIDEIHTIVGAGSTTGSMDASNILKPALARGEIQCIGATTTDEYRKNIEKDGALDRRFQKVMVEPTTVEETIQILHNIKDRYEDHHNVKYTDKAIETCVKLTDRYISDRFFPDKAIDALDEAGSRIHLTNITVPKNIEEQEQMIADMTQKKHDAVTAQNYELAASFRDKEKELNEQLDAMKNEWEHSLKEKREIVDEEQIEDVVSMMSGIPVQRMAESENERLKNMADVLKTKVIAQDEAVETLVKAIRRSRIGLKDPNRPIGTFMFLGPTGVGKTYLAKQLAKSMFGSEDSLIRIDMSEYMDKYTVSRLIGAPPGYVGYEEGGQLTEKVHRKPYSIILLDEIEKAHPDVFNILLQIMDEGRLTDSYGKTIDFKNTVIIMTSNAGTRQLKEFGNGIGFNKADVDQLKMSRSLIDKALNKTFSPEFLNRIDEIITFDQLSIDSLVKILDIEMNSVSKRLSEQGYTLELDNEAKKFLAGRGYNVQFGARPLRRAIQNFVEDDIAEMILNNKIAQGNKIMVTYHEGDEKLSISIA
jgi:ATP-dependent Clp protease ATP-binding subunit ClpC